MASNYELSRKFVFFIFLLVLCGDRKRPLGPVRLNKAFADSVKLSIGLDISTAVKVYSKRHVVTAIESKSTVSTTIRAIILTRQFLVVNLILLCNDISTNPGPVANGLICSSCLSSIKRNQPRLQCSLCRMSFHLKCLDENYELSKICRLCSTQPNDLIDPRSNSDAGFAPKLAEIIKQRGLKIIHQNIRSVIPKIDELRNMVVRELKSEIHIIALTETWVSEQILDGEIEIPGYNVFRKDRDGKGGGVLVFVRSDLSVVRRRDLENASVEGLWLEILLPKSRGILLGTFYRPPTLRGFMIKILCLS